ncbi:hypothetical protein MNBD_CHLOROFLEXI01-5362 [hydrothermal vent metagenome]|uniref:Transposase IS200-like domain-containing protein n=1 Tax=hydrothermal vent metagenome TaxID=652676 RepID=A0A3B0W1L2_9ZZZZ
MSKPQPLRYDTTYHIYNRGNNGETIFRQPENYLYFLKLFVKHFHLHVLTYAYCLMPNHFHFLLHIRSREEIVAAYRRAETQTPRVLETLGVLVPEPSQAFGNVCNAYTKAINKRFQRTGSLFENPFDRIEVTNNRYFCNLITYIHHNPQTHGFVDDFRDWPYTSYDAILTEKPSRVARADVLDWFGSKHEFVEAHETAVDEAKIEKFIDF